MNQSMTTVEWVHEDLFPFLRALSGELLRALDTVSSIMTRNCTWVSDQTV
jgi:hypothetical protein